MSPGYAAARARCPLVREPTVPKTPGTDPPPAHPFSRHSLVQDPPPRPPPRIRSRGPTSPPGPSPPSPAARPRATSSRSGAKLHLSTPAAAWQARRTAPRHRHPPSPAGAAVSTPPAAAPQPLFSVRPRFFPRGAGTPSRRTARHAWRRPRRATQAPKTPAPAADRSYRPPAPPCQCPFRAFSSPIQAGTGWTPEAPHPRHLRPAPGP